MDFEAVIGLEVHVELLTKTKIYCGCSTEFGGKPNSHVCPTCMALPGALPHLNKAVVEYGMKAGLALNCSINQLCRMDRKHYFYPDSPRNYQITQDEIPLCRDGYVDIEISEGNAKRIGVQRIHIEDDAGKLLHTGVGTLVDYNRAGVPLIEIVSNPDMRTPEEATLYLTKLKSILSSIGVSDCKMEEGSLRCDANISVRPKGSETFGVRTEIKNMNSFKALEKAITYEFNRQIAAVQNGEKLTVETRRWNEEKGETAVMRSKEMANDYRYFPEGDLVTLNITDEWVNAVKASIPELPHEKAERFVKEYGIPKYDAMVLTLSTEMADFYDEASKLSKDPKAASNWMMGDVSRLLNENNQTVVDIKFKPSDLAELILLINAGTISNAIGKQVVEEMFNTGKGAKTIVDEKGLVLNNDEDELLAIVNKALDSSPESIEKYKSGRGRATGYIVGLVMKETKGKANPQLVNKLVDQEIAKR